MKIFLQARVNSKRFPKKVLKEIYKKKNSLEIIIDKISKIGYKDDLVILTSNKKSDNLIKTLCKKKYKRTKKQRGGFICQLPDKINIQSSYFNKSDDNRVNSIAYSEYLDECKKYSSCVFQNINNIDLLLNVLAILKDIGNNETNFKYKN